MAAGPATSAASTEWSARVNEAVRDARIEVIGRADVKNESHAEALVAMLRAYGASSQGFLYVEPHLARKAYRPQDILLCHPAVGVLVVEVKGHTLEGIQRVVAGHLIVRMNGFNEDKDAFEQAQCAMFDVKHAFERRQRQPGEGPVFEFAIALPNILGSEWDERGFSASLDKSRVLFRDDLGSPQRVRAKLGLLVENALSQLRRSTPIEPQQMEGVRAVFGDSEVLERKRSWRESPVFDLGAYIDEREACEKNLSREQQELSREEVRGYPRLVRGVAGSGKTVVLANMAARRLARSHFQLNLLEQSPREPRIGVVCFNAALVSFLDERIARAFQACSPFGESAACPIRATYMNGLMFRLSQLQPKPWTYLPPADIENKSERAHLYRVQLARFRSTHPEDFDRLLFDCMFVDEGQDFEGEEYRLLLDLIRPDRQTREKAICIFYDDAQNVYGRTLPTWIDLGIDVSGGRRSRVMKECFRNTRQIVEVAFNVLVGAQSPSETRVTTRTFSNYADLKKAGLIEERENAVLVHFSERQGDAPVIKSFHTREAELAGIAGDLVRLVCEQHVRPEDLLVLFERRAYIDPLSRLVTSLMPPGRVKAIRQIHQHSPDKETGLLKEGCLTIATTKSAKGYDAPVVFLGAVDEFGNDTCGRASFYVGATRAKYLLFLSGIASEANLFSEARDAIAALYRLDRLV